MGFGDVSEALEGNYSSYTQKWVSAAITGALGGLISGAIKGDKVLVRLSESVLVLDLTDGTIISQDDTSALVSEENVGAKSVLGKYFVTLEEKTDPFRIYKDGVLLQSVEVTDTYWYGFIMSADGRYIVVWDYYHYKLYCYEGS